MNTDSARYAISRTATHYQRMPHIMAMHEHMWRGLKRPQLWAGARLSAWFDQHDRTLRAARQRAQVDGYEPVSPDAPPQKKKQASDSTHVRMLPRMGEWQWYDQHMRHAFVMRYHKSE